VRKASIVRLKPGADSSNLIIKLRQWESTLTRYSHLRSFSPEPDPPTDPGVWEAMNEWHGQQIAVYRWYRELMQQAEEYLRAAVDDDALDGHLFTSRYWYMIDNSPVDDKRYQPAVGTAEFERICRDQAGHLKRFRERLEALAASARGTGTVVVPDTNIFAHCGTVHEIDWRTHAAADAVRIIIPHVVIDELDDLKHTLRDKDERTRVRDTIRALKQAFSGAAPRSAVPIDSAVTVAILPDPDKHERLPSNDEEICDRTALLKQFTSPVVLASNDMGMHLHARAYGLDVIGIPEQPRRTPSEARNEPARQLPGLVT
jgi:PIN domain